MAWSAAKTLHKLGWLVGNHGATDHNLAGVGAAEALSRLQLGEAAMLAAGIPTGANKSRTQAPGSTTQTCSPR